MIKLCEEYIISFSKCLIFCIFPKHCTLIDLHLLLSYAEKCKANEVVFFANNTLHYQSTFVSKKNKNKTKQNKTKLKKKKKKKKKP